MAFFDDQQSNCFYLFGGSHLLAITIPIIGVLLIYIFRNQIRNRPNIDKVFRITLIVINFLFIILFYFYIYYNNISILKFGFPLHICSISVILVTYALWKKSYKVFEVLYFWSIGAVFAIITPDLTEGTNNFCFYEFFTIHTIIILGTSYFLIIKKYKITFSSFIKATNYLMLLFLVSMYFNKIYDCNYMFTNMPVKGTMLEKIEKFSIFNTYLIPLFLSGFFLLFLIYIPWLLIKISMTKRELK